MKSRERALVYSLLLAVLAVNGVVLAAASARPAMAGMRALLDTIGPTDGVVFSGEENENITLRAEGGHLAWSDNAHSRLYSIAFVDQHDVITKLLETDLYTEDRERLTEEIQGEQTEWNEREAGLREKYADITEESDPRIQQAQADFAELRAEFSQWQNSANQRVNDMAVTQLQEAYQEVLDAIDIVADRKGIDVVMRFTPRDAELAGGISGQTMLDIRMRPALRYPDELDITPDVLEEMALD